MTFIFHLSWIKALSLSQESRKISIRFLTLKLIYPLYFTWRQMDKVKLLIKK